MLFKASEPYIKQSKVDKGWTVSFQVSQDQYDQIKDLPTPKYEGILFNVSVETDAGGANTIASGSGN